MNGFNKLLAATFLTAAMMFTGVAQAMDIQQFNKMADQDQDEYAAALLQGAEKVLKDEGRSDLADQLDHLFTDVKPGNHLSEGMADFEVNLSAVTAAEIRRQQRDPSLRHLRVEDAFKATAEDHGIPLPSAFDSVAADFHPKHPPRDGVAGKTDAPSPREQ